MIRVSRVPEPPAFDSEARRPGQAWLAARRDVKRPRDFWSRFKNELRDGFRSLCGYAAMYDPTNTGACCGKRGLIEHVRSRLAREDAMLRRAADLAAHDSRGPRGAHDAP